MVPSTILQQIARWSRDFIPLLLASSVKASVITAVVWAAARLIRRRHPVQRHVLWLAAVCSCPIVLALAALVVAGLVVLSAAGQKELSAEEAWSRFVGGWVNPEYHGEMFPYQQVLTSDRMEEEYVNPKSAQPDNGYRIELTKCWWDRGSTYCQYSYKTTKGMWGDDTGVGLMRVDRAGKVLEMNGMSSMIGGPTEPAELFDFDHMFGSYGIYNRKLPAGVVPGIDVLPTPRCAGVAAP